MWQGGRKMYEKVLDFYSHIPCGMWQIISLLIGWLARFLLTHPVWDVTFSLHSECLQSGISTHTSRVGCDALDESDWEVLQISTHTSRVGCDGGGHVSDRSHTGFLLTHPVWDVTMYWKARKILLKFLLTHPVWDVTAHACGNRHPKAHFYSHIPCGMWLLALFTPFKIQNFYSHIPCGMWQRSRLLNL